MGRDEHTGTVKTFQVRERHISEKTAIRAAAIRRSVPGGVPETRLYSGFPRMSFLDGWPRMAYH